MLQFGQLATTSAAIAGLAAGKTGNLDVDPGFVDTSTYRLAAGSPAIDSGQSGDYFPDVDGSQNDMGAYGGMFPLDFYDNQRAAGAVWIMPLSPGGRCF